MKDRKKIFLLISVIVALLLLAKLHVIPLAVARACDCHVKSEVEEIEPGKVKFTCYYMLEDNCAYQSGWTTYYGSGTLYALILYEDESGNLYVYWVPKPEGYVSWYSSYKNPPKEWIVYFTKEFTLDKFGKYYFICAKFGRPTLPRYSRHALPRYQEQYAGCSILQLGKNPLIAFKEQYNKNDGIWIRQISLTDFYREGSNYILYRVSSSSVPYRKIVWDGYELRLYSGESPSSLRGWKTKEYLTWDLSGESYYVRCDLGRYAIEQYVYFKKPPEEEVTKSILDYIIEYIRKILELLKI